MKRNLNIISIIVISFFLFSCSSDDSSSVQGVVSPPLNVLDYDITIYDNIAILDASTLTGSQTVGAVFRWKLISAPNNFDCYKSDCYLSFVGQIEAYSNNNLTYETSIPELSFLARQVGEYIINLQILDINGVELSSNDFTINVIDEIPIFTYNNVFTEDFSGINRWVLGSYSIEQMLLDNAGIWTGYSPGTTSVGGGA